METFYISNNILFDMYEQGFRKAAVELYKYFGNMKKTAAALKIGLATVWRWVRIGIQPKTRIQRHFPTALLVFVENLIEQKNFMTQIDIKYEVKRAFQLDISRKCVSTILKLLNLSRKRLRKRGFCKKQILESRLFDFKNLVNTSNIENIVSIDEIGFDQRMTPLYGYSRKGSKAIGYTHPTNRKRINVIMAIDVFGKRQFKLIHGPVNTMEFNNFIKECSWNSNSILIMDNVSFHRSKIIKESIQLHSCQCVYIPPYTPECNPIENVFSILKNNYRKGVMDLTINHSDLVTRCINNLDTSIFRPCFESMQKFINK